jgi:hypothetical protein
VGRSLCVAICLTFAAFGTTSAGGASGEDSTYERANTALSRSIPHYPRARLLIQEPVGGEVGVVPFEAIQRFYFLARPNSQRTVIGFFRKQLGSPWRQKGSSCLVSRSRLVALMYPKLRRVGVLIDSRGATRCHELVGQVADLLAVGYPNA